MAQPATALDHDSHLRVLLMGAAKSGKTTCAVATAPSPVRVIMCEDKSALRGARRETTSFDWELLPTEGKIFRTMQDFLLAAKNDAKAGKIKTLVVDPLSTLARRLLEESFDNNKTIAGKDNGMVAYGEYNRRFDHLTDYMMTIPCHVIAVSHYSQVSAEIDGQIKKSGDGVVPLIPGASRTALAAKFVDVMWFDFDQTDREKRILVVGPQGVWGRGSRSMKGNHVLPADFGELIKTFAAQDKPKPTTSTTRSPTTVSRPPLKPVAGGRR